jgi:hypothetical protein
MGKKRRLLDEYRFPGVRPRLAIQGMFGDPRVRIIQLDRTQKKRYAAVAERFIGATTTKRYDGYGICHAGMPAFTCQWRFGEFSAGSAGK